MPTYLNLQASNYEFFKLLMIRTEYELSGIDPIKSVLNCSLICYNRTFVRRFAHTLQDTPDKRFRKTHIVGRSRFEIFLKHRAPL